MFEGNIKKIGLKIQQLRKQKNLTQEEFAQVLGVTRGYVGYIEQGRKYPSLRLLMKMADLLKVNLSELVER